MGSKQAGAIGPAEVMELRMMYNPQEWENEKLAQQIRALERSNPKLARKRMFENPALLFARRQVAESVLRRKV